MRNEDRSQKGPPGQGVDDRPGFKAEGGVEEGRDRMLAVAEESEPFVQTFPGGVGDTRRGGREGCGEAPARQQVIDA